MAISMWKASLAKDRFSPFDFRSRRRWRSPLEYLTITMTLHGSTTMGNSLKNLGARINSAVDWFIPAKLRSSDYLVNIRMFLFSHLFGPFLGHTISLSMLYIDGGADASWWIFFFAVTA